MPRYSWARPYGIGHGADGVDAGKSAIDNIDPNLLGLFEDIIQKLL